MWPIRTALVHFLGRVPCMSMSGIIFFPPPPCKIGHYFDRGSVAHQRTRSHNSRNSHSSYLVYHSIIFNPWWKYIQAKETGNSCFFCEKVSVSTGTSLRQSPFPKIRPTSTGSESVIGAPRSTSSAEALELAKRSAASRSKSLTKQASEWRCNLSGTWSSETQGKTQGLPEELEQC